MKKLKKKQEEPLKLKEKDNLEFVPVELRKMIKDDVKKFVDILGVNNYKVRTFFYNQEDGAEYETVQGSLVAASTLVDDRYLVADIKVYPFFVDQWKRGSVSDEEIHGMVAHEISHIATNSIKKVAISPFKTEDDVREKWESLTTTIGRLLEEINRKNDCLTNTK